MKVAKACCISMPKSLLHTGFQLLKKQELLHQKSKKKYEMKATPGWLVVLGLTAL